MIYDYDEIKFPFTVLLFCKIHFLEIFNKLQCSLITNIPGVGFTELSHLHTMEQSQFLVPFWKNVKLRIISSERPYSAGQICGYTSYKTQSGAPISHIFILALTNMAACIITFQLPLCFLSALWLTAPFCWSYGPPRPLRSTVNSSVFPLEQFQCN